VPSAGKTGDSAEQKGSEKSNNSDQHFAGRRNDMEDVTIIIGILRTWNRDRGFGFVEEPTASFPIKKYFLHAHEILEGQNPPPLGSLVRFELGAHAPGGKFPSAKKAWIVAPKDVTREML
jgi:hypothetical protein